MNIRVSNQVHLVVEADPVTRNVFHLTEKYRISFPYLIYLITLIDGRNFAALSILCRTAPIASLDDVLYGFAFPNTSYGGSVCGVGDYIQGKTDKQIVEIIVAQFWNSKFSYDELGDYSGGQRRLDRWQKLTKENPLYWMDYGFPKVCCLKDLVGTNAILLPREKDARVE